MKEDLKNARIVPRIIRVVEKTWFLDNLQAGFANAHSSLPLTNDNQSFVRQSRKFGFTLAEVLITLGIIGVVAAMTLPTLIQKHDKNVTITSLRKFHTTLAQAKLRSEADYGEMSSWDFPSTNDKEGFEKFFDKYFRPYLSVINECTSASNCKSFNVSRAIYTLADGTQFEFAPNYNTSTLIGTYIYIIVDINGNKGPNKRGRDIFDMNIMPKHGAVMLGQLSESDYARNLDRDEIKNGVPINNGRNTACCNDTCATTTYKYHTCGALIQADGWQIKDDYPW